jgi:hypothetical protein
MKWDEGDRSGCDEMFPTILACPCPDERWQSARYPDHGEVWSLPWRYEFEEESVRLRITGVQVPYLLEKSCSLSGASLQTTYRVTNETPFPISYLWCAHNLLAIAPGMEWVTGEKSSSVVFQHSQGNRMTSQPYQRTAYPKPHPDLPSLAITEANYGRHAEKFKPGCVNHGKRKLT